MQEVAGKVAFITGGASGLGLAMARAFTGAGMKVAIADIEQSALDAVADEFAGSNAEVITLKVDVSDRDAMEAAAVKTEQAFGNVHVVCNNAGVAVGGSIEDMSYQDWDWVMKVNTDGVINGVQTFVNRMLEHGEGGHFINTASMAGHMAVPGLSVYNMSKFAVVGLSEAMRADLADKGVGVSVLCPGVVSTRIFESGRNRPDHLAAETDTASVLLTSDVTDDERAERLKELLDNALEPSQVGDMVLQALLNDDFYIFTHPELKEAVTLRGEEISNAFQRWDDFRQQQ